MKIVNNESEIEAGQDTSATPQDPTKRIVGVYGDKQEKGIRGRQEAFCQHMAAIGTPTYSNMTQSAIAAEYSEKSAAVQGHKLMKNPAIRERIDELLKEHMQRNNITVDKVLADLENDKLLAREHNQFSVAVRCDELHGKFLALFTDNINQTQQPEPKPMSDEEIEDYRAAGDLIWERQEERRRAMELLHPDNAEKASDIA